MRTPNLAPEQQIIKVDDLIRIADESFRCCTADQDDHNQLARTFVALVCGNIEAMYGTERGNEFARALGFEHLIDKNAEPWKEKNTGDEDLDAELDAWRKLRTTWCDENGVLNLEAALPAASTVLENAYRDLGADCGGEVDLLLDNLPLAIEEARQVLKMYKTRRQS